jgi:hypothetical protein
MEQLLSNDKPRTPVHSPRGSSKQQQQQQQQQHHQQQQQEQQEHYMLQSPISAATEGDPTLLVAHYAAAIAAAPPQVCTPTLLPNHHVQNVLWYESYSACMHCEASGGSVVLMPAVTVCLR